jgi:hypothetical protein
VRFHFRKTWKPGPFRITVTEKLRPTWGVRIGPYGYDPKTGRHSFDTPGLGWLRSSGRSRSGRKPESSGGLGIFGVLKGLFMFALVGVLLFVVLSGWPG